MIGPPPRLRRARLAGIHLDSLCDHERRQQPDTELADGGDCYVAGGQLASAITGAGAADNTEKFLNIRAIHAGAVVAKTQRAGAFIHLNSDDTGRFPGLNSAQLNTVVRILQKLADEGIRFRVQAFGQQADQPLKIRAHFRHRQPISRTVG